MFLVPNPQFETEVTGIL